MKIYTKKGDAGETSLYGGARISKTHDRIAAYGQVDELNASIGVVLAHAANEDAVAEISAKLAPVQQELFVIGSHLATQYNLASIPDTLPEFKTSSIERLEQEIDKMESALKPLKTFIIPGGSLTAAELHVARTVCRRAERATANLAMKEDILPDILTYLNRLSDFFFVLARAANAASGKTETLWKK